ncbi:MAG: hypothetical protein U0Y96_12700 [Candidatus Kapaibacterium sp.]|nr:hypothetical protein [Bacteroidota bacterium]
MVTQLKTFQHKTVFIQFRLVLFFACSLIFGCYINYLTPEEVPEPVAKFVLEKDTVHTGDTIRVFSYSYCAYSEARMGDIYCNSLYERYVDYYPLFSEKKTPFIKELSELKPFDTTTLKHTFVVLAKCKGTYTIKASAHIGFIKQTDACGGANSDDYVTKSDTTKLQVVIQ